MKAVRQGDAPLAAAPASLTTDLLAQVEEPVSAARVALVSGRSYEIESGAAADRLVVRSGSGEVVLRIEVGERGPVLSFESAELVLTTPGRLALDAGEVAIRSRGDLTLEADGELREKIAGHHHTEVGGDERLEASNVQVLAATGKVEILAQSSVHLDGEHIGLNDNPVPVPFPWSRAAADDE